MKRFALFIVMGVGLSVVFSGCNLNKRPPGVPVTGSESQPLQVASATETEVPVDLAGPPMELGSKYTYIDGTVLVAVPGGKFIMGYGNPDNPVHDVTVGDFWVYSTKVTNQQFANCVNAGVCTPPDPTNNPAFGNYLLVNLPVTGVNYDQAAAYCSYVHGRLPTEAEWEKTARGPDGNIFPWGNGASSCDLLNYNFCVGKLTGVTTYAQGASYYGALDMSGNVREWVADWYDPNYYSQSPSEDPLGPELGQRRSVRGSSYQDSADFALSAHRFSYKPVDTLPDLGFRCVVEDPIFYAPYCQTPPLYGTDENGRPTKIDIPLPAECKQPGLQVSVDCKTQTSLVTVPNPLPAGWNANIPADCSGGPTTYQCKGDGQVTLNAPVCKVSIPASGVGCPLGYTYNPTSNSCVGRGPGTQCMPGFNYDPASQCCVLANSNQGTNELCPPGFSQLSDVCISSDSDVKQPTNVVASFSQVGICGGQTHNGGEVPACDPATNPSCGGQPVCDPAKDPSCGGQPAQPVCVPVCSFTDSLCTKPGCPQTCTTCP